MCIHRIIYTVYFFYINVCYTCVYLYANCIACFFKPKLCSILFHSDTCDRRFPLMNFERTSVQTSRTVWVDPKFLQHIQGISLNKIFRVCPRFWWRETTSGGIFIQSKRSKAGRSSTLIVNGQDSGGVVPPWGFLGMIPFEMGHCFQTLFLFWGRG